MTSLMYAVFSIATLQCSVRPEISPCTCESGKPDNYVELSCEKLESFHTIVDVLSNMFQPYINIDLKITHSKLEDLEMRSFTDMNLNVVKLRMQWNNLRSLPELPFRGLSNVKYLSVGDNDLEEIPKHVLNHMPVLQTVDIGRCRIRSVLQDDLKGIQMVTNLILPSNNITRLDRGAFPPSLIILHLGRNQIESLNGSLHHLNNLESLFINANSISELDGELQNAQMLKLLMAHNNRLERLPESMRTMDKLEIIHLHCNRLKSLDGVLRGAELLNELFAHNNELEYLAQDEFQACQRMELVNLACNRIPALNSSLLPLTKLKVANLSFNLIEELSMDELYGLRSLKKLDLSYNRIQRLRPSQKGIRDLPLVDLLLDHNQIITLDASLAGLSYMRILSLSYNNIERIGPGDFDDMERLEILDMCNNQVVELKELETANLPSLKILKLAYNNITKLEKEFYGLPVLCQVNLTNNQIVTIRSELVSRTRCKTHNVAGKLEIHLDDNPIICDTGLRELCELMTQQDARIRGRSQCFENDQEVCTVLPMLYNFPMVTTKSEAVKPEGTKLVMQILPPSLLKNNGDLLPPIIATLGQPLINQVIIAPSSPLLAVATQRSIVVSEPESSTTPPPTATTTAMPLVTTTTPSTVPIIENTTTPAPALAPTTTAKAMVINTTTLPTTTIAQDSSTTPKPNETLTIILNIEEPNVAPSDGNSTATLLDAVEPLIVEKEQKQHQQHQNQAHQHTLLEPPPPVVEVDAAAVATVEEQREHVAVTVAKTEYETVEYIPNMVQPAVAAPTPPSKTNLLEEDSQSNSVHEEYQSVMLSDLEHAAQSLQIPEEPPEE